MKNHEPSFQNPEYFDFTKLYLDTVLYDSTFNKVALFVIAENPIHRNPHSDSKLPYYYYANYYLGKRLITDSRIFDLKNIGPVSIVNFDDKAATIKAIRESYYSELITFLDADRTPFYDYNVAQSGQHLPLIYLAVVLYELFKCFRRLFRSLLTHLLLYLHSKRSDQIIGKCHCQDFLSLLFY